MRISSFVSSSFLLLSYLEFLLVLALVVGLALEMGKCWLQLVYIPVLFCLLDRRLPVLFVSFDRAGRIHNVDYNLYLFRIE